MSDDEAVQMLSSGLRNAIKHINALEQEIYDRNTIHLRKAAMLALTAIEQGETFQYMDDVVAPALRLALANIQSGIEADKNRTQRHVSYACPQCHWTLDEKTCS